MNHKSEKISRKRKIKIEISRRISDDKRSRRDERYVIDRNIQSILPGWRKGGRGEKVSGASFACRRRIARAKIPWPGPV